MLRRQRPKRRKGMALLMCLMLIFMVSVLVLNVVHTETLQFSMTRHSIEYEQALYWAHAGVHDVCSELVLDDTWRGTTTDGTLPPASSPAGYSATAVDDGTGNVVVTSVGYSGQGHRTVSATIEL